MTDTDIDPVLVGRESTPEPSGVGSSTLGEVLRLEELGEFTGRRGLVVLSDTVGRGTLREHGFKVFPAVPGLIDQSLRDLRPGALVVDAKALEVGPWAGVLTDAAPDLLSEITGALATAQELGLPIYWLGEFPADVDLGLAGIADRMLVVTPGSELYRGPAEGAPASRLLGALRRMTW